MKPIVPPELLHIGADSYLGAGAILWREGDPGGDVAVVLEGALEVYRETPEGDLFLDSVEPGQAVGELGLDGGIRTAAVRAHSSAHVLRVGADQFRQLIRQHPDLLENLYWTQVNRLRRILRERGASRSRRILDASTRACSYPFFLDRLEGELHRARASADPVSIVLCQPDGPAEEEAVVAVARCLRERAARGDVVGRHGDAQLAVLLYGADAAGAREAAEGLRRAAETASCPLSAGVATFPTDGPDAEVLLRAADVRLYQARDAGGNRVA